MDGECWSEEAEIREKSCGAAGLGWAGWAGLGATARGHCLSRKGNENIQ